VRLVNVTETIVLSWTKKLLEQSTNCKCKRCYLDIVALTLNSLPSMYVVSTERNALITQDSQLKADAIKQIKHAMEMVAARPHHQR